MATQLVRESMKEDVKTLTAVTEEKFVDKILQFVSFSNNLIF